MATPDDGATDRWAGLAVGLSVATMLGLFGLLIYLLGRRQPQQALSGPPVYAFNGGFGAPQISPVAVTGAENAMQAPPSFMQTYSLPALHDINTPSVRLASATTKPFDVILRVVGPAGSFAAFSLDPTELNRVTTAVPTGQVVIVQSGETHPIRLLPRQAVFGKGQTINTGEVVYVSITANEVGTRLYS